MNRNIRAVLHAVLGLVPASCCLGRDDDNPVKINDAISMVRAMYIWLRLLPEAC